MVKRQFPLFQHKELDRFFAIEHNYDTISNKYLVSNRGHMASVLIFWIINIETLVFDQYKITKLSYYAPKWYE